MILALAGMLTLMAPPAFPHEGFKAGGIPASMRKVHLSTVNYTLPTVNLVRDDGQTVSLKDELDDGRPVVVTFIYTACRDICPMTSQVLSQLQRKLGPDRDKVHLLSISIDPENDTPPQLRAYARRFGANPESRYYTGTVAASVATQRAFNVFHQDKMSHTPVVLLRAAPGKPWLRVDGFATADDLLQNYRKLMAAN
ncbi:SCO family protein [Vogesella sp. LIG4]|uniref:SCO family protein n=1 Tax=Vogesella sp. LIG4 TaxID=1192162 RepID=UPI0018D31B71|nr:SCO family protein [Vogesella sp. LIG4]